MIKKKGAFSNAYTSHNKAKSFHQKPAGEDYYSFRHKENILDCSNQTLITYAKNSELQSSFGSEDMLKDCTRNQCRQSYDPFSKNRSDLQEQLFPQDYRSTAKDSFFEKGFSNCFNNDIQGMGTGEHKRQRSSVHNHELITPNKISHRRSVSNKSPLSQNKSTVANKSHRKLESLAKVKPNKENSLTENKNRAEFQKERDEDKRLIDSLRKQLSVLQERAKKIGKDHEQRILQYEEYSRELNQSIQKLKKYEDGIKFTIMWMLEFYWSCQNAASNQTLHNFEAEFNRYFAKAFKHLNQHLEQFGIQSKLKVLAQESLKAQTEKQVCLNEQKVPGSSNEDSNIQPFSNLSSLNNSFEDTFNFDFRRNNSSKDEKESDASNNSSVRAIQISRKLFEGTQDQQQSEFRGIHNSLANKSQNRLSDLEYSLTQQIDLQENSLSEQLIEGENQKIKQRSDENTYEQSKNMSEDLDSHLSYRGVVLQDFETSDSNYISPLVKGDVIDLVRKIDHALWIGETSEKMGYVLSKLMKISGLDSSKDGKGYAIDF